VLRHVDKFRGAAGAATADGGAAGAGSAGGFPGSRSTSDSDEDGEDAGAGGYQSRPRGAKAAKRDKAAGIQELRIFKASTDALSALAQATSERTTVAFLNSAEMRDTPEAVALRRAHARKLMTAAGLALSRPDTLSEASPPPACTGDAPAAGESTPSTPALTSSSTPRMPPAQELPAGTAVVPESTPTASAPDGGVLGRVQSHMETCRKHGIQSFDIFPQGFLKSVKCNLYFCVGVRKRRDEKRKPRINTIHKIIQERAGRAVSSVRKCTGRPFSVRNG